ncbi:MAG: hypothetical protein KAJ18_07440 [Candidatus Omnitrophica bacterium]|nr:hypothetical protein [Candidatus Omnitrophota bacterium]
MRNKVYYEKHRFRLGKGYPETEVGCHLIEELRETQWSKEFESLMRNRLVMGALRYGRILGVKSFAGYGKPKYDRMGSVRTRLDSYLSTGNKEFLVDIANLCLLEFVECSHPQAHFESVDDGEHVKIL